MTRNYDLTPAGEGSPAVRIFGATLQESPKRAQTRTIARQGLLGGDPTAQQASEQTGVEPGVHRFVGWWLDPDTAPELVNRLETILNDPTTERVDLQAVDGNGDPVSSRYNGSYRLGDETRLTQLAPEEETWRFDIRLTEAD